MTGPELDRFFMERALRLAARGRGRTSPNPMVGAVVARGERLIAEGYHERVGGPHAEVNALACAGGEAAGATLYVTLEPCNHFGRTPPCTQAIAAASVARVVVGMADPNPQVSGGGAEALRARGIQVEVGVIEEQCRALNQPFIKHVTTGRPLVTLKLAATLDGRIAARTGDARWITNERSRSFVHQLRCHLDAILVGRGTAVADDPLLTARTEGPEDCRQPVRIVLDTHLELDPAAQLVRTARQAPVLVVCGGDAPRDRELRLTEAGVEVLRCPTTDGSIRLDALLDHLGRRPVTSLLVEGGARVAGAFLGAGLVDELCFFYAPKILGDAEGVPMVAGLVRERMAEALPVYDLTVQRFGDDVLLRGRLREHLY